MWTSLMWKAKPILKEVSTLAPRQDDLAVAGLTAQVRRPL